MSLELALEMLNSPGGAFLVPPTYSGAIRA
jgi:hypothetical protein